ncbi:hypothetical protein I7I48_10393 [Histoplasma ohiense]|nr:hypothetical protein I7I48_10393 [Histoplasma ohiense (nom. inval.)]
MVIEFDGYHLKLNNGRLLGYICSINERNDTRYDMFSAPKSDGNLSFRYSVKCSLIWPLLSKI